MKKTLFVLNIGNYEPELMGLTLPLLKYHANKIDAEFHIITERKFQGYGMGYEKLQIYELGKDNDINILIDGDCLLHPDFFDISVMLEPDECFHMNEDFSPIRFKADAIFKKDARYIGAANWFIIGTKKTHDLWKPMNLSPSDLNSRIFMTNYEQKIIGLKSEHAHDEYVMSHNIAEFSLKHLNFQELRKRHKMDSTCYWHNDEKFAEAPYYFCHDYRIPRNERYLKALQQIKDWKL